MRALNDIGFWRLAQRTSMTEASVNLPLMPEAYSEIERLLTERANGALGCLGYFGDRRSRL
jgi:hypothetical protein